MFTEAECRSNLHQIGNGVSIYVAAQKLAMPWLFSNGSGDYAIAFSTDRGSPPLDNRVMSPLFQAVIEATEEAIYNSLFRATTMSGNGHTAPALPIRETLEILERHRVLERR